MDIKKPSDVPRAIKLIFQMVPTKKFILIYSSYEVTWSGGPGVNAPDQYGYLLSVVEMLCLDRSKISDVKLKIIQNWRSSLPEIIEGFGKIG